MGKSVWTQSYIDQCKKKVRSETTLPEYKEDPDQKLRYLLARIDACENQPTVDSQILQYIYIMSCLVHHERYGGLSAAQVTRLTKTAESLLRVNGVKKGSSKLSFLYGELHLVRSQIHRKYGEHWPAAWEQQMGILASRASLVGGEAFQTLAYAGRALRLGAARVAIKEYHHALSLDLKGKQKHLAEIGIIRSLRLSGKADEARCYLNSLTEIERYAAPEQKEIEWERFILEAIETSDLSRLIKSVKKNGLHNEASYICECFFWSAAFSQTDWLKRTLKLKNIARQKKLLSQKTDRFFESGIMLERCYDYDYPLATRYDFLNSVVLRASSLLTIDKELLVWAATSRWLARSKSFKLAVLTLNEYSALSYRLSDGQTNDVLKIMDDLLDKPWYKSES